MTMQAVAAEAKKAEEEKKTKAATSAEAKKAEQQKKARSSVASSHSLSSRPARDASGKDLTGQDEPRLTGKLKLKTGWGWWWARRHVELKCGKLQWWRKEPQGPPDVELRLSDGVTRWVLTRHEGNIMELMSENHSNAVKDGERVLLRASSEGEAQQWAQALQEQIQYVEMLLAWPMPMDGRQGDIRFYGVEYP
ncbi:unnamed protein product [Effrenium voratum]|nr:unnamed protein product [Effrenium voratum]